MGGWKPPWGIELRVDMASAYVMFVVSGVAAIVLPFGPGSVNLSVPKHRMYLFYAAFLLCLCGRTDRVRKRRRIDTSDVSARLN